MVQSVVEASDRRLRNRNARSAAVVAAAAQAIQEQGIEAVTIKSVAERLDCAVGTIYTYFPSKGALIAAVQIDAIERLGAAFERCGARVEEIITGLDVEVAALARVLAFGRSVVAANRAYPEESRLQQRLVESRPDYGEADLAAVSQAAFAVLARPEQLLREAAALGVIAEGNAFDRTVTWLAAVSGVLSMARLRGPATEQIDVAILADRLNLDLLGGWGAREEVLAAADSAVPADAIANVLREDPRDH
jgi:AcrR family transcriptional regulator